MKRCIEVTVEIGIGAPRSEVWTILSDSERLPEWFDEFESAQRLKALAEAEGRP